MTALLQFAQELIDEVIDHLHDDTNSLRSCALASRSCAMRARKHIHSNLVIGSIGGGPKMVLYPTKVLHYKKIHHLRNFPTLSKCVRTMTASESMESLTTGPISFPRLHTLRLFNIVWRSLSTEARAFVQTAFGGVKSLILNNIGFDCFDSFLYLLDAFPALSELTIENCYFQHDQIPDDAQRVISLRRLTIVSDKASNIFVEWLKAQIVPTVIDELVIPGGTGLASDATVNALARIAAPSLRHLRFAFGWVWPHGFLKPQFDLSPVSQLSTLEVTNISLRLDAAHIRDYTWLPDMLKRNGSRQLRRITLHFHYDKLSQLDHEGLGKIDAALNASITESSRWSAEWRELKEVEFVLWPNRVMGQERLATLSEATSWIEQGMPKSAHNATLKCYDGCTYSSMWEPIHRFAEY
ncbi:hypothetical protein QCA50_013784 [Cerrena zonata]|uniref:F-box domain-containing protein n=1 Tax=Cerrena zonata TaxID=2478898 RepID=A0AAW0FQG8_9APHY